MKTGSKSKNLSFTTVEDTVFSFFKRQLQIRRNFQAPKWLFNALKPFSGHILTTFLETFHSKAKKDNVRKLFVLLRCVSYLMHLMDPTPADIHNLKKMNACLAVHIGRYFVAFSSSHYLHQGISHAPEVHPLMKFYYLFFSYNAL